VDATRCTLIRRSKKNVASDGLLVVIDHQFSRWSERVRHADHRTAVTKDFHARSERHFCNTRRVLHHRLYRETTSTFAHLFGDRKQLFFGRVCGGQVVHQLTHGVGEFALRRPSAWRFGVLFSRKPNLCEQRIRFAHDMKPTA
jgi:hypothetical protein